MNDTDAPALPDIGILSLVPDPWSTLWQPRHHVLTRLARFYHVCYVEPSLHWRRTWSSPSKDRAAAAATPGFVVHAPERWLPELLGWPRVSGALRNSRWRRARQRLVRRGCRRIVLYVWRPEFAGALDRIPHDLSCYHIDDEYSFSRVEEPIDPVERDLIERVDRVFIHSPALLEKKGKLNPQTTFVPNGVDYRAHATVAPEPLDLLGVPRPRIGYTGRVKRQLDWPLIEQLVLRHENWQFVFVGAHAPHDEVREAVARLSPKPNLCFLGAKSVDELAVYPQHFDACIMPYRVDDYTRFIYPMKVNEYLASGTPTAGSSIRSLEEYAKVVELARTSEEWSRAIERCLSPSARESGRREDRQRMAQLHDWDRLTERVARRMAEGMGPDVMRRLETVLAESAGQERSVERR